MTLNVHKETLHMKTEIGNIVIMPLDKDIYGVSRIVNIVNDTCLFELFVSDVFKNETHFNVKKLILGKKIYIWGYNDYMKEKKWKINGNYNDDLEIQMPYYIHRSFYSEEPMERFYIQKGDYNNPAHGIGEKKEISEQDIDILNKNGIISNGIAFPETVIWTFLKHLEYNNVIKVI